jgi:hypothetical protein
VPVGATIGAAVIGAGATVIGSSKASKAQTQAANQAAGDQLAVAEENNQLARDMYDANATRLDPYSDMGLQAGDAYMGILLGTNHTQPGSATTNGYATIPTPQKLGSGSSGTGTGSGGGGTPSLTQIMAMQNDGVPGNYASALSAYYAAHPPSAAQLAAMKNDGIPGNYAAAQAAAQQAPPAASPSALAPVVAQQAQQAIAAGADPQAVAQRAAQYGVRL